MFKRLRKQKKLSLTKKYRQENGQSLVEFALLLPILLLIVCGTIDFGWLFYNQLELNNSCREGARFGVVNTAPADRVTRIQNKVNAVTPNSLKPLVITVVYSNTTTPLAGDVTVTLKANVRILTPVLGVFSEGQLRPIVAKVTMKTES